MARSAKEVVNEHFQVKERTLCVCHDQVERIGEAPSRSTLYAVPSEVVFGVS